MPHQKLKLSNLFFVFTIANINYYRLKNSDDVGKHGVNAWLDESLTKTIFVDNSSHLVKFRKMVT